MQRNGLPCETRVLESLVVVVIHQKRMSPNGPLLHSCAGTRRIYQPPQSEVSSNNNDPFDTQYYYFTKEPQSSDKCGDGANFFVCGERRIIHNRPGHAMQRDLYCRMRSTIYTVVGPPKEP